MATQSEDELLVRNGELLFNMDVSQQTCGNKGGKSIPFSSQMFIGGVDPEKNYWNETEGDGLPKGYYSDCQYSFHLHTALDLMLTRPYRQPRDRLLQGWRG